MSSVTACYVRRFRGTAAAPSPPATPAPQARRRHIAAQLYTSLPLSLPAMIDEPLTSSLPQQFDCNNNEVHFGFSHFLELYQLDSETHQAVFNEIGHVKLLEDLVSSYFVGRATLNKTVLHLTGRFACLLREYGTSDSETLHADVIGEIELLAKELSTLLSQLSQLMGLSNAATTAPQELQEARNSDKASRDSKKQLKQRLQKTEEALKKTASEPKPEAAGASPNHDQHAELENLRSQICEFSKKEAAAFETDFL